jgi:hypothetical protein
LLCAACVCAAQTLLHVALHTISSQLYLHLLVFWIHMFCVLPVAQPPVSHEDIMNTAKDLTFVLPMSAISSTLAFSAPHTAHVWLPHTRV